jgi:sarcosine oxidase, subunit beta
LASERILVLGAGSTGSSAAYNLAKMGKNVVLIDMGQPASGTTSKSTALVRTHYSNEIVARMAIYSLKILRDFTQIGISGFVNAGMLFLGDNSLRSGMQEISKSISAMGIKTESIDPSEAAMRFPEVDFSGVDFVDYEPESGYADSVAVATSYVAKAREMGADEIFGVTVAKLEFDPQGRLVAASTSDGQRIHCSKAVLCSNVWTNAVLENTKPGAKLPIWASAHPVAVLRRPASYEGIHPIVADFGSKTYFKPEGQTLLLAGSLDPAIDQIRVDPFNPPSNVGFEFLSFFAEAGSRRIPAMKDGILHSSYFGMYDMSPDQHPIIDELSSLGLPDVYCCVGLSGHGFKLCPALGIMIAEMVSNSLERTFEWDQFGLSRFENGKLLKSKYTSIATIA